MHLTINGDTHEIKAAKVFELLQEFGLPPAVTVVERNLEIVELRSYGVTVQADGDVLELVRLVGGVGGASRRMAAFEGPIFK
jgi:thiamine biosynthesis protein ThiS